MSTKKPAKPPVEAKPTGTAPTWTVPSTYLPHAYHKQVPPTSPTPGHAEGTAAVARSPLSPPDGTRHPGDTGPANVARHVAQDYGHAPAPAFSGAPSSVPPVNLAGLSTMPAALSAKPMGRQNRKPGPPPPFQPKRSALPTNETVSPASLPLTGGMTTPADTNLPPVWTAPKAAAPKPAAKIPAAKVVSKPTAKVVSKPATKKR